MLLSVVSVLVVAQPISEIPEGLMNNPVYVFYILWVSSYKWLSCGHALLCTAGKNATQEVMHATSISKKLISQQLTRHMNSAVVRRHRNVRKHEQYCSSSCKHSGHGRLRLDNVRITTLTSVCVTIVATEKQLVLNIRRCSY